MIRHLDLFSGIGGFALAAEAVWGQGGVQHTFVEYDPFCRAVLKKHWPKAEIHGDIREFIADANESRRGETLCGEQTPGRKSHSDKQSGDAPDSHGPGRQRSENEGRRERHSAGGTWDQEWFTVATRLCTVDDGLPGGLVRPRGWRNAALKGAGNAIVPQVATEIMRAIKSVDL